MPRIGTFWSSPVNTKEEQCVEQSSRWQLLSNNTGPRRIPKKLICIPVANTTAGSLGAPLHWVEAAAVAAVAVAGLAATAPERKDKMSSFRIRPSLPLPCTAQALMCKQCVSGGAEKKSGNTRIRCACSMCAALTFLQNKRYAWKTCTRRLSISQTRIASRLLFPCLSQLLIQATIHHTPETYPSQCRCCPPWLSCGRQG